jgi:cell division GTPase FtsZ
MKPADRALNIVAIGLGQAGGNIAAEFHRLGYPAMALNTAHTDLSALAPAESQTTLSREQRIYIGLDGYDGAGADLNYGRECIRENAARITHAVRGHTEGADVVLLIAGLGGGTGSALSELVDVLDDLELPVVTLATLPGEHESGIAKVNAARGVSELVKRRPLGWVFADNQRLAQSHGTISLDRYYEAVNQVIVAPLDALNRLNNRDGVHPLRTLDGEDFRRLLLSSGVLNYAETLLAELSLDAVTEGIRESLLSSGVMPAGFSLQEIAYMGIVLEAPESTLAGTPFSFFEQLSEQLKNDTGGGAIYVGMYRTGNIEGGAARLRLIGSSQSLPSGIQAVVNDAKREGSTLRDKLQRAVDALDLGEIEQFDLFKTHARTHVARKRSWELADAAAPEKFTRYAAHTTPASNFSSESPPKPVIERLPTSMDAEQAVAFDTQPDSELPERDTQAYEALLDRASNIPPSGAIHRSPAESDTYTKLAEAFLNASSDSIRTRIARRLDVAQNSESLLIREHANQAIDRIRTADPGAFEAALMLQAQQQAAKG